jgi:putative two-component system response regulator
MMYFQATHNHYYRQSLYQFGLFDRPPQFRKVVSYISKPIPSVKARETSNPQLSRNSFKNNLLTEKHNLENIILKRNHELEQAQLEIVTRLGMAAEYRDEETGRHIKRMSKFCRLLGMAIGLSKDESFSLERAATMHDVGKIGISDSILFKQGKLSEDEKRAMQQHTVIGARLLAGSNSKILQLAEQIALTHHEKWDGSGYPKGLKGNQIPMVGRITCICDVFDALISNRPYKRAWSVSNAIREIKIRSGSDFDPGLVVKMVGLEPELRKVITTQCR